MRNAVKLSVPIVCPDCRAVGGDLRPRTLGGVVVFDDAAYLAWYSASRKSRHAHEHTMGSAFPAYGVRRSRERDRFLLGVGKRAEVPCGRKHRQPDGTLRPTIVVIDDDAVTAALRRAGVDPAEVRRLTDAETHSRVFALR